MSLTKVWATVRATAATGASCVLFVLALCIPPSAANADSSCDFFFQKTREFLNYDHRNYTSALWSTTYFNGKGARYLGTTMIPLRVQGGDITGQGTRHRVFEYPNSKESESETVSISIRQDGKVVLSNIYGPYDPTCFNAAGMSGAVGYFILRTGDSIEVINFVSRNDGRF